MIILCGDYRIKSDKYNWIIEKKHTTGEDSKTPGKDIWVADQPAYPGRLSQAFEYIFDRMIKDLGEMDVTDVSQACKQAAEQVAKYRAACGDLAIHATQ
jgi:hypothetical protein